MTAEQLKKSILQMAVQGKLVPQDPNDEPASVLLSRIREEKEKLIKDGKIKKEKNPSVIFRGEDNLPYEKIGNNEPLCIADEVPFEIPESWEWIRHNELFEISGGSQPPKSYFSTEKKEGYIRLYQIRDYGENPVPVFIPEKTATKKTCKGDILLARYGASLGKVFWAEEGAYNVAMAKVIPLYNKEMISKKYLYIFYQSELYQSIVHGNSRSAQAGFNKDDLSALFFPLPPYNEQIRIVNKYEKIYPLLEKYSTIEIQRVRLNKEFPNTLKKSILQQAVMGKLVPQNPNDEPASILLERIREEKQALIKAGKLKKDKNESIIYRRDNSHYEKVGGDEQCIDNVLPFEIPNSWEWVHLNNVAKSELGKTIDKSKNTGNPKPYLCSINIHWYDIDLKKTKYALFENEELIKYKLLPNDLLICEGGDVGRSAIWKENIEMYYQNALHRVRFFDRIEPEYFLIVLEFFKLDGTIIKYAKGMTIKHLVQKALNEIYFPIPPIDEQKKIILKYKKINDLLSLFAI